MTSMDQGKSGSPGDTTAEAVKKAESVLDKAAVQAVLLRAATIDRESDCMTSIYFAHRAREEISRRQRYGGRLSMLLIIPDRTVETPELTAAELRRIAGVARQKLRTTDLIGRWDNNEIAILLTQTGLAGATRLAKRICAGVAADPPQEGRPRLTASIGTATWLGMVETLGTLLERARGGAAEAQSRGGNSVAVT